MSFKYVFTGVVIFVVLSLFGMAAMIQRDRSLESSKGQAPLQKIIEAGSTNSPDKSE